MMRLSKKDREIVKQKFGGRCAYCGCDLPEKGWHADHVTPCMRKLEVVPKEERRNPLSFELRHNGEYTSPGANNIDNMWPACAPCNLFKSTFSVEMFREQIAEQVNRAAKSSVNYRTALRFGLIKETGVNVEFWFERFQSASGGVVVVEEE